MAEDTRMLCPVCGKQNIPNTLFCVVCGTYLAASGPPSTEPLAEKEETAPASPRADGDGKQESVRAVQIEVEIVRTGRRVLLNASQEMLIGRMDQTHGIFPQFDLTEDEGNEQNVSRRHARMYVQGGTCFIEDLGSTNGTFVNDARLTPHVPYGVQEGDSITLGSLRISIRVLRAV